MSKRERKKADEKDRKEAELAAVTALQRASDEEKATNETAAAEKRRLADPAVQQQLTYNVAIEGAVLAAVSGMLGSFVDTVYAMEKEAAQQSSDRPASTSG